MGYSMGGRRNAEIGDEVFFSLFPSLFTFSVSQLVLTNWIFLCFSLPFRMKSLNC